MIVKGCSFRQSLQSSSTQGSCLASHPSACATSTPACRKPITCAFQVYIHRSAVPGISPSRNACDLSGFLSCVHVEGGGACKLQHFVLRCSFLCCLCMHCLLISSSSRWRIVFCFGALLLCALQVIVSLSSSILQVFSKKLQ